MLLCFLNNLHSNLKFTCEIGPHQLVFQDILISLSSHDDLSLFAN